MGNLIQQNSEMHQRLDEDMTQLRNQTHDWMQAMLNRLPVWAVSVLTAGGTALGAMAMWILTHK